MTIDTPKLRRSTRATPSQTEITPLRKSTRLEKLAPVPSALKSKPVVVASKSTPLRRSDRGKKQENSSSPSGLKKLENESNPPNNRNTKGRLWRNARCPLVESPYVSRSNKSDSKLVGGKRKRISVAGDDKAEESDKSSQNESGENSGSEISEQDGEESSWKKSESTSKYTVEEQPHNCSEKRSHKSSKERLHNSSEGRSHNSSEEQSSELSENHSEPNVSSDPNGYKNSEKEDKLVDNISVKNSTGCNIPMQISPQQYTRKRCKIACKKTQKDSKRLKFTTESNSNSTDAESSDIPRDSSQKGDAQVDNSTTLLNGDLPSSSIRKVKSPVKFSQWKDKEVQVLDNFSGNSEDEKDWEYQKTAVVTYSNFGSKKNLVEEGENSGVKTADILNPNNNSSNPVANSCIADVCSIESEERTMSPIEQTSFKFLLRRKIFRLSELLTAEEDQQAMAISFLDYVIENHHVNKEPGTILQAFVISVCWIAASLVKKKVDKKESISLARKHLGFTCVEEEVESVYSKLRLLKKNYCRKIQVTSDVSTIVTDGIESPQQKKINEYDEVATLLVEKGLTATIDPSDLSKSEGQLSEFPDKMSNTGSDKPDSTTNKNDDVTSTINCASPSAEPLSLLSDRAETDESNHESQTSSHDADIGHLSEFPDKMRKTGSDKPDSATNKNDDVTITINCASPSAEPQSLPSDRAETDESNHESQTPSHDADMAAYQFPPCTEPTLVLLTEGQTPPQNAGVAASQLAEGPSVVISQDVLQTGENQEHPESQPIMQPVVGPTGPDNTVPVSNAESAPEVRNPESSQIRVTHAMGPTQGLSHSFPLFMESQLTSRVLNLPSSFDPLQNDIDNMRRVKDQAVKAHEDCKSRIKYECEKEIGEIVAQIRRKHGDRLREADALYLSNITKYEMHYNKVYMNRLLSHAFRIKCVGPSTDGLFFVDNVPGSSLMQQQSQFNQSFPPPVTATSSVRQQTIQPLPPVTASSSVRHHTMPPSGFPQRSAPHLTSSNPTRHFNINNVIPAVGTHHSTATPGNFHSPAPHLQRSRPPSIFAAGLPPDNRVSPGQQPSFQPLFRPLQSLTDQSTNTNKSLPSALGLLFDMDKISPSNRPNLFPLLNPATFSLP